VRVGAYFHDIGKMERPDYYIENQREGKNRHDNLNPSMSSLIIVSHVTDGLEMAKKYKLIPQISDMITEHHGTQTIRYFYQRAKDREQPSVSAVKEQDFKYPGEIPKSRESAILALADSVEAATRSLQKPTSTRLRQVVFKIIQERFLEGQLDKSQLTLRDMKKIGNSFVRILHGIFHYRVEYPEDKENDENIDFDKIWSSRAEQDEDTKEASDNFGGVG
jgi:putative nucleotidyltransferase with HDIG domain